MFGDLELVDTVWVGTKPKSCVLVVLAYCNGGRKQGRKEGTKNLSKSVRIVIFANLLPLEVSQSILVLVYVPYNIVL